MSTSRISVIAILALATVAIEAGELPATFLPVQQQTRQQSYVAPPMHLEVWPLSHGAEFVGLEERQELFVGQTLVAYVTLRNLWSDPVQVVAQTAQWLDSVQFQLLDQDGASVPSTQFGFQDKGALAPNLVSGTVGRLDDGVYVFGSDAEERGERRFLHRLDEGHYRLHAALDLLVAVPGRPSLRQSLAAHIPLVVAGVSGRAAQLEVLYREAMLARVDGRFEEARDRLHALLKVSPNSSAAHILLGDIAGREYRLDEARSLYQQAQTLLVTGKDIDSSSVRRTGGSDRLADLQRKIEATR